LCAGRNQIQCMHIKPILLFISATTFGSAQKAAFLTSYSEFSVSERICYRSNSIRGFSRSFVATVAMSSSKVGAVREILKMGDPRLLRVAKPVSDFGSDELHNLILDLHETMRAAKGAGLAAPQIGVDLQVVVFGSTSINPRYPDRPIVPPTVLINPVITPLSDEMENGWEGCLSVPGMRGEVPRWKAIRYTGFDQLGAPIDCSVDGFHARVVQHECDHLWGKL
jgi:peptide deformylase